MNREQLEQLKPGDAVIRERFGHQMHGVVERVEPDCIFIRFPGGRACFYKGYGVRHLKLNPGTRSENETSPPPAGSGMPTTQVDDLTADKKQVAGSSGQGATTALPHK